MMLLGLAFRLDALVHCILVRLLLHHTWGLRMHGSTGLAVTANLRWQL